MELIGLKVLDPKVHADDIMLVLSEEKIREFFYTDNYEANYHVWAVCVNGRAVGAIWVTKNTRVRDRRWGEMEFVLGSNYRGRGIGITVVKMAAKRLFEERLDLIRLEAILDVENVAAIKVLEKVGFRKEGTLRQYSDVNGKIKDFAIFSFLGCHQRKPEVEMDLDDYMKHSDYLRSAHAQKIPTVSFADRKQLSEYLSGKVTCGDGIEFLVPDLPSGR